ncbi:MAG TPA: alpha/beta hydrolase [Bacteroidales bacterium]|nr:alpha/beta hydrolase [Bacteroidales bacterium]
MNEHSFFIDTVDGKKLFVYEFLPLEKPKAIVQITHGMAEQAYRYKNFAAFLCSQGFAVYAPDLRGHGKTAGASENLGFFAENSGVNAVLNDMYLVLKFAKNKHGNLPYFKFGHSMGSFFSRRFVALYHAELTGAIFSGTAADPGLLGSAGKLIANIEGALRGKKAYSKLLNALTFGSFSKALKNPRTELDWLSRDPEIVDEYIADPYCGFVCTASFYADMLELMLSLKNIEHIGFLPAQFPIYFFAGQQDPVGNFGKGVTKVAETYKATGLTDVSCKLYPEARHEMLNELNKEEVYADVLNFLNKYIV